MMGVIYQHLLLNRIKTHQVSQQIIFIYFRQFVWKLLFLLVGVRGITKQLQITVASRIYQTMDTIQYTHVALTKSKSMITIREMTIWP